MTADARERCPVHNIVLIERFDERGALMIPTGEYYCLRCARAAAGPPPKESA